MANTDELVTTDHSYYEELTASAHSLDDEIEELDDNEYDIPPVTSTPTLESILYESDNDSNEDDNGMMTGLFLEVVGDSLSVASTSSFDSKGRNRDRRLKRNFKEKVHGSVLRHVILRGVSSQIVSAADRVSTGVPTAMAVSSMIAVGTSHGIVLVFDVKQALKWCLGDKTTGDQYGAVSSLGFNDNCTRLLCGFVKGQITMWDVTNCKLLRTIVDVHPLGTAVLHIQFTDDPTLAVCADSGGSVFELAFKKVLALRGCDSRCIFSGSRGEVCAIQVLNMLHLKTHPLQEICFIALATLSKVIVISIRPSLRVHFNHVLKASPTTLPIMRWQTAVIQFSPTKRVIDPVLSFGRENVLYFFQMTAVAKDKIHFIPLQKLELDYSLLNFLWLNSRTMVVLDVTEHLHVVDVKTQEELEIIDLADVKLVYGSSHFKGLATGGNVSKAMAMAGDRSCYQSFASYQGQLLILGTRSVHVMTLRIWIERIDQLVKQSRYTEALALAMSFYADKAKAVLGLVSNKDSRKRIVSEKMIDLLDKFMDHTVTMIPKQCKSDVLEEYFLDALPPIVEYSIVLNRTDLLQKYYERVNFNEVGKSIFLESLETHILSNTLTRIAPLILHDFVEHYDSRGLYQVLENCLLHLNVETLDMHQVVTICRSHNLYDGLFYIFTRGLGDYTTPFQELLSLLEQALKSGTHFNDETISLGNKLLVYISCCLAGRAYPYGNISDDQRVMVKTEMFRCLTLLHTKNSSDDELPYPYLRTFLKFDTRELLNFLALAFEEPEFKKDAGLFQRQRLVDILLQIMVDSDGFTPSQIGALFTFLARQIASPDNTIVVNRLLFEQVLEYLTNPNDESRHAERQQALMELLTAGGLQHYDEEKLLKLAEQAEFFQVCELLYDKRKEHHKILSCYLRDKLRQVDVFHFIESKLLNEDSNVDRSQFISEVLSNIKELIQTDNVKASIMILKCFPEKVPSLIEDLNASPDVLYKLLSGLVNSKDCNGISGLVDIVCNTSNIQETYIRLMAQIDPHLVTPYIKSIDSYKIKNVLRIVEEFGISEAVAHLLEKMGDVHGAFAVTLENFKLCLDNFKKSIMSDEEAIVDEQSNNFVGIKKSLVDVVQFCQRTSRLIDESEREEMWLSLLETTLNFQKQFNEEVSETLVNVLKVLISDLLNAMIGHVKLSAVIQHVLQDPLYGANKIGDMKDLFIGMLESYHYEMTLLSATKHLVNDDLHYQLSQLWKLANRGYSSHNNICHICGKHFNQHESGNIILFRCHHGYHEKCLAGSSFDLDVKKNGDIYCITCNPRQMSHDTPTERRISEVKDPLKSSSPAHQNAQAGSKMNPEQLKAINILKSTFDPSSKLKDLGSSSLQLAPLRIPKFTEDY